MPNHSISHPLALFVLTAGRFATRRFAPDSKCRRPERSGILLFFAANALAARRHFGIGRGLRYFRRFRIDRARLAFVAARPTPVRNQPHFSCVSGERFAARFCYNTRYEKITCSCRLIRSLAALRRVARGGDSRPARAERSCLLARR